MAVQDNACITIERLGESPKFTMPPIQSTSASGTGSSQWQGMASLAKTAFLDLGTGSSGNLLVPGDLTRDFYPYTYARSALFRLHCRTIASCKQAYCKGRFLSSLRMSYRMGLLEVLWELVNEIHGVYGSHNLQFMLQGCTCAFGFLGQHSGRCVR